MTVNNISSSMTAAERRAYEQIWIRGGGGGGNPSFNTDDESNNSPPRANSTAAATEQLSVDLSGKNINTRILASSSTSNTPATNYPVYANAALSSNNPQLSRSSGSYDNVRMIPIQLQQHDSGYNNSDAHEPPNGGGNNNNNNNQYKNIPFSVEELSRGTGGEDGGRRRSSKAEHGDSSSQEISGGYEPVNFHNLRINERAPAGGPPMLGGANQDGGGYGNNNRGSKTSLLSSTSRC